MTRHSQTLRMYGSPSEQAPLDWGWVEAQLAGAETYWVVAASAGHPHPRPVWGAWVDDRLHLSLGSPALRRALAADSAVTVHLDSGTEVVIVEGHVLPLKTPPEAFAAYNSKYDWSYDADQYGAFTTVQPARVMAWRTKGPGGRDGFTATGRWTFDAG